MALRIRMMVGAFTLLCGFQGAFAPKSRSAIQEPKRIVPIYENIVQTENPGSKGEHKGLQQYPLCGFSTTSHAHWRIRDLAQPSQ
jgi:hypothetical protein